MNSTLEEISTNKVNLEYIQGVDLNSLSEYRVLMKNNNISSAPLIVDIFVKIVNYTNEQATYYTMKVHKEGQAFVFWGKESVCIDLVKALAEVFVVAEVLKNE